MWCGKVFCVFLSFILFLTFVSGQIPEGTPCYTPDDIYGICINIKSCEILVNLLLTRNNEPQVVDFLRRSTCGYVGRLPMVCCPQPEPKIVDPINPGDGEDPTQIRRPVADKLELPRPPYCGYSNVTNSRVVGGIPAVLGEFPWMVVLGYKNAKNPSQTKWLCGGTLITNKHILTAAHCVYNRNDLYIARLGELDLYSDDDRAIPVDMKLAKAKIHEDYDRVLHTNDIAILTLAESENLTYVWPICLPVDEPYRSRDYLRTQPTVAGWGSLYFNGPTSSWLQEVALPVVANSQCQRAFGSSNAIIDDRIICAGFLAGGRDSCKGDSGGPLMFPVQNDNDDDSESLTYYQVGIVSYGFKCAEAGYPGVYTRVTAFLEWIKRNLD